MDVKWTNTEYEMDFLVSAIEAVLFAGGEPVERQKLCELFGITKKELELCVDRLSQRIASNESSFELLCLEDSLQLCTKNEYGDYVSKFLEIKRTAPMSKAALEALAVVAYRQPVTKGYIEKVRGVDCSGIMATLISRNLIEECGRLDAPGKPILYRTTPDFLRCFGLSSVKELDPEDGEPRQLEIEDSDL
ncbi:MAG: SMC-Scp complex subunit ScpB [Ruminococcaceae bacterium]|nr:SMC-Scp complex subunit ScpB [Oscillospiraceae bacterium]